MVTLSPLPIDPLLPDIVDRLATHTRLVLAAPPGAGKTTRVPPALLQILPADQRVIVLEPRRLAARGAAQRMADERGEALGDTIGLSTRLERKVSARTRIEVVTDGLFTRRILADPELAGVGAVLFDEVHERSLNIDLALALALDAQAALRPDLHLAVMSATLETERLARLLQAPVIESRGRQFPVETIHVGRPPGRLEDHVAETVVRALDEGDGSVLVFLPGMAEILRTAERLGATPRPGTTVHPLHGGLAPGAQETALAPPAPGQRKVILSTDIAESALTVEGVRAVVDAGLTRQPDAGGGSLRTRLVTVRAARTAVDQRRGRAGRTAPGRCYRLWDAPETRGLPPAPTPEILRSDLSGLVLALADFGEADPARLVWLDPPPPGQLAAARSRLQRLGALGPGGEITPLGRRMATLPLAPELAALVCAHSDAASRQVAARIAALLSERGLGGEAIDLATRLAAFERDRSQRARALWRQAERWSASGAIDTAPETAPETAADGRPDPAEVLATAWPHAIARARSGPDREIGQFLTAGGEAVRAPPDSPLARAQWIVVADAAGGLRDARITLAAPIPEATARRLHPPEQADTARFDPDTGRFSARRVTRMGAIRLSDRPLATPSGPAAHAALVDALNEHGLAALGARSAADRLLARIAFAARTAQGPWPDWTSETLRLALVEGLDTLVPTPHDRPAGGTLIDRVAATLDWALADRLAAAAPDRITLPSGRAAPVDYLDDKAPLVEARVQELYGQDSHPCLGPSRTPVTLSLTSPAGRPVAVTGDLPGFWRGGYGDMAKDMRARYPKHDWPDDPAAAAPHEGRTKARLRRD